MATLIDKINGLSVQIKTIGDSQVSADEARGFAARAEELSGPSSAILVAARQIEQFRSKGIKIDIPLSDARTLKRTIDDIAKKYSMDPRSILTPNANWRLATKTQLVKLSETVKAQLHIAWRSYVMSVKPTVDQGLLLVLQSSPTYSSLAKRVEALTLEFAVVAEHLPITQQELDAPIFLANELKQILENLPTDIPLPVRELFQAINRGTATAANLTDDAIQWLREKNLLTTLRISWRTL